MSEEAKQESQPPEDTVSDSFRFSLARKGQYVRFPVLPDEYYFRVDAPAAGAEVSDLDMEVSEMPFDEDGTPDPKKGKWRWRVSPETFVDKCVAQVTDFCIPVEETDGRPGVRQYDAKNEGDNRANKDVYKIIRDTADCQFRTILNGAMDFVAGNTTPARKEFEELLQEQPQLLTTS